MPPEFLTTKELAELLRIKERKVYDLAATGELPCSKAMGKLLFPRDAIDKWLSQSATGSTRIPDNARPDVFLGSHDPLLNWALRESESGIATIFDGSFDGLDRFERNEGIATGLHIYHATENRWNTDQIARDYQDKNVVLIEWAKRRRGLLLAPGLGNKVHSIHDLKGRTIVPRQKTAGSQALLNILLERAGLNETNLKFIAPSRTETDSALAVSEGKADAAFGLMDQARHFGLDFKPLIEERFDLLIDRRAYFESPVQKLLDFTKSPEFIQKISEMQGYDMSGLGHVHFNG